MDAKSLRGIAVVSIKDGAKLGTVDELIFDTDARSVLAFRLGRSGLFGSSRDVVLMRDVDNIGQDALMISSRDMVRSESDERELHGRPGLRQLGNRRVVTQDGTYVGNLATIQIDPNSGEMSQIEVGGGDLMQFFRRNIEVPASEIVSIGGDVIVIPNGYAPGNADEDTDQPAESDRPEVIQ